ncbi:hypothetical protein H1R20_g10563, partial [Candolleomyces eurysporus]
MAKTRDHIKAGIDFARNNNVRLIIRNTGHDFMGRSTGFGSLAINTHSFKSTFFLLLDFFNYTDFISRCSVYPEGRELLRLANQQNPKVAIVTGECPTVGFAGGYIQGGGHGPLASYYGMAADQALSYEVVTAAGEFLTVNADSNPDLFWGLRGGGPSTFAALVSVTVKTYPETPAAGITLSLSTFDQNTSWRGFAAFHNLAPRWVDNGMFVYYELFGGSFNIRPFVGVNMTRARITEVVQPLFDQLRSLGIQYNAQITEYPTFFDLYTALFQDEGAGITALVGGRLFTKRDINANGNAIVDAMRRSGAGFVGHIVGPRIGLAAVDNAIHPAWRDAASFSITSVNLGNTATWAQKQQAQQQLTNQIDAPLRDASPNGAAYVNEGNLEEPNWQTAYWGTNYPRLLELRRKWDPQGVFYARTTPGTESWEVVDYGRRLCRRL